MSKQKKRDTQVPKNPETENQLADVEPIRSSFSLDRYSREAIRRAASEQWYASTQGEIVNLAPLLFSLVADLSLEKRRQSLSPINGLVQQALASIRSIKPLAPHLGPAIEYAEEAITDIVNLESEAIKRRDVHGVKQTYDKVCWANRGWELLDEDGTYADYDYDSTPDPLLDVLQELQKLANSHVVVDQGWDGEIDFQCCEGLKEQKLRKRFGDSVAKLVISGLISEEKAVEIGPFEIDLSIKRNEVIT